MRGGGDGGGEVNTPLTPNWAQSAIDALAAGVRCRLRVYGNSMRPRILSGSTVTLHPRLAVAVGDVVLVDVGGRTTLHAVREFSTQEPEPLALIGDERGNVDGWVPLTAIQAYGTIVLLARTGGSNIISDFTNC